jgi:hypothetical protein
MTGRHRRLAWNRLQEVEGEAEVVKEERLAAHAGEGSHGNGGGVRDLSDSDLEGYRTAGHAVPRARPTHCNGRSRIVRASPLATTGFR